MTAPGWHSDPFGRFPYRWWDGTAVDIMTMPPGRGGTYLVHLTGSAALEALADGFCTADEDFRVTYWNAAAERLFGWTAAEVHGRPAFKFFDVSFKSTTQAEAVRQVTEAGRWSGIVTQLTKDGRTLTCEAMVARLPDEEGRVVVLRDLAEREALIGERRRAEEAEATSYSTETGETSPADDDKRGQKRRPRRKRRPKPEVIANLRGGAEDEAEEGERAGGEEQHGGHGSRADRPGEQRTGSGAAALGLAGRQPAPQHRVATGHLDGPRPRGSRSRARSRPARTRPPAR